MRNRITYGQSAIFCSQPPAFADNTENVSGLRKIQNANVSFDFNRERYKQVGSENFIGDVHLRNAEIQLSFDYLYSNGINEALIGLNVNGADGYVSKYLKKQNQDRNIYIVFGDNENNNIYDETTIVNNYDVCSLGNCYLNSYSISAAIGEPISVATSFSAYNLKLEAYDDINGKFIPAINTSIGEPTEYYKYKLEKERYLNLGGLESENNIALSPTEIELVLPNNVSEPGIKFSGEKTALIQNLNLSFEIQRNDLYGFGSMYPYGKRAIFPILCNMEFSVITTEFEFGNLHDIINQEENEYNFTFNFKNCNGATGLQIQVEKSLIESESFQQSIGSNGNANISMTFPISNTTGLKMSTAPLVLKHPEDSVGSALNVTATGKTPFTYKWYDEFESEQIGQTGPSFTPASAGNYYCVIFNDLGSGVTTKALYNS